MGRKVYNAKARNNTVREIDNSKTKEIQIEFKNEEFGAYDEANALVLPSTKRKSQVIKDKNHQVTRILSKKKRKTLEKIVDKKKKKEARSSLLDALAAVQVPVEELKHYTSISQAQTLGVKNSQKLEQELDLVKKIQADDNKAARISSIAGKSKRKRLALLAGYNEGGSSDEDEDGVKKRKTKNLNIISLEDESDSDKESDKEQDETIEPIDKDENSKNIKWIEEVLTTPVADNLENKEDPKTKITTPPEPVVLPKYPVTPTVYVHVDRDPIIQAARLKLPILAEEQQIMETINENQIIIIAGETGSGKTTQVPQFLYEAGYAEKKLIGITEPRRVAAISMSKRVATEMNLSDKQVSYLIRFEGNVSDSTKIKFMTDGVLLKEIETDFLLNKYSAIILDEAHERSSYTDILIGLLSRIVPLRNKKGIPLKLIIMSATLRVEDFISNTKLFKYPPPVLTVEARQFPVTIHFQKRTPDDYLKEAYKKITKIHNKLPEGGILVFLTGQQEVNLMVRKLRKAFPIKDLKNLKFNVKSNERKPIIIDDDEFDIKKAIKNVKKSKKILAHQTTNLPQINLDNYKLPSDDTEADLFDIDDNMNEDLDDGNLDSEDDLDLLEGNEKNVSKQPLWVLPLYSLLSSEKQAKVFSPVPDGCRLCVVSTNVAETSLTIPNIKYVVDTGRQKTRLYDKITGVCAFVVTFTSKASANQRAGRAGRISPGHCYRLFSSAIYSNKFEDFSTPDIQKKPVDDLMLQMKCMGIDKVINFPFPSAPDLTQMETAEKRLILLGALENSKAKGSSVGENVAKVTQLGLAISAFPVAPRFGKMLALSHQKNLLPYTVCMVAALSVQEVLLEITFDKDGSGSINSKWYQKRRNWAGMGNSLLLGDPMVLLKSVGASEYAGSQGALEEFCEKNGLRSKAISEIRKLRIQLTNEINLNLPDVNLCVDPKMEPPTDIQAKLLRQILLTGMGDHVARKLPEEEINDKDDRRKFKMAYNCADMVEPVFMHSGCVLKQNLPKWLIYQEVYELQNGDTTKMFMRGCTAIEPEWLLTYVPKMCNILSIKDEPTPKYNALDGRVYCYVEATFGKAGWPIPVTEIEMPLDEKACRHFGMFFLNGEVFPKLLEYKNKLKSTPSSIIKSWSNLNEFVANFTKAILSKEINSKQKLLDIWKTNPKYLLQQYTDLLYDVPISILSLNWPPIDDSLAV